MPGLDRGIQPSVTALLRARFVVAAILLTLHWTAPSLRPLDPLPKAPDTVPAFSSGVSAAQAGTLPRALPRAHAFESGLAKQGRSLPQASGKLDALAQAVRFTGAPTAPAAAGVLLVALQSQQPAHDFQARAPPRSQA